MGFSYMWVDRVMRFISTVSYAIVLNGRIGGRFSPTRMLRQGDPLSSYLFLICGEGLSSLLRQTKMNGLIKGAKVAKEAPRVSHLLFADDSLIFEDATVMGASNVLQVLQSYATCSGQLVNFAKSSIFFQFQC